MNSSIIKGSTHNTLVLYLLVSVSAGQPSKERLWTWPGHQPGLLTLHRIHGSKPAAGQPCSSNTAPANTQGWTKVVSVVGLHGWGIFLGFFFVVFQGCTSELCVVWEAADTVSQFCQATKISLVNNLLCYHHNRCFFVLLKFPRLQAKPFRGKGL